MNLFQDEDGSAYAFYLNPSALSIARLQEGDYTKFAEGTPPQTVSGSVGGSMEAGIFKHNNQYYMVDSGLRQYAVADSLYGPWSSHPLMMWNGTETTPVGYHTESSSVLPVPTSQGCTYIHIGDS